MSRNFYIPSLFYALVIVLLPSTVLAQLNAGGDTLIKPNFKGVLLQPKVEKRQQTYVTTSNPIQLKYQPNVLKPMIFNEEQSKDFNYLNLYGGSLSTLHAETSIRIAKQKNTFLVGLLIDKSKATQEQQHGNYGINSIWTSNYKNKNILTKGGYQLVDRRRYGHAEMAQRKNMTAHLIDAGITLISKQDSVSHVDPFLNMQLTTMPQVNEQLFQLGAIANQKLRGHRLHHQIQYQLDQINASGVNKDNSMFDVTSQYLLKKAKGQLAIGATASNMNKKWYALPNIQFNYLYNKQFNFQASYSGTAQLNSLRERYRINPFAEYTTDFKNTWVRNLHAKASYLILPQLTVSAGYSLQKHHNYATYLSDSSNNLSQHFIATAPINQIELNAFYKVNDDAVVGLDYIINQTSVVIPYLPASSINAYANWLLRKKIRLTPNITYWGKRQTDFNSRSDFNTLKPALNANLNVYYQIGKSVQLMGGINNITNASYQLFKGYNVYQRQVLAGILLKNNQ